ncbi:MAG: ABC transporter permease [Chloroflexi bacterium]|nr:ABC transporter permease [Chloroflexota bacterium]
MNPQESLLIALGALMSHKLRSGLTMLGMVIGVGAVILLMAIGQGVQADITNQISNLGSDILFIMPGRTLQEGFRGALGSINTLTFEDAEALETSASTPAVAVAMPIVSTFATVSARGENYNTQVTGNTWRFLETMKMNLAAGRFFTEQEYNSRESVAVLGQDTAKNLFGEADPVGDFVKINGSRFRVVGLLEKRGSSFLGISQDDVVIAPGTTVFAKIRPRYSSRGGRVVSQIALRATSEAEVPTAKEQTTVLLRRLHRIPSDGNDDFVVTTLEQTLSVITNVTGILTIFLAAIAGISLVVGGIGIMNIMIVSVTERTREIGLRKALGAKRRDILAQFLLEAVTLSVIGGAGGALLGWLLALLIGSAASGFLPPPLLSANVAALAISVSVAIGLFFGIYPAYRAAGLHPIEALRYE